MFKVLQVTTQTSVYYSVFMLGDTSYEVTTTETDAHGHLSWKVNVTDQNKNEVIAMDYDIDEREWVGECNGMFIVSSKQNPALAARDLLSNYYIGA